jgi:hypothetical protein
MGIGSKGKSVETTNLIVDVVGRAGRVLQVI